MGQSPELVCVYALFLSLTIKADVVRCNRHEAAEPWLGWPQLSPTKGHQNRAITERFGKSDINGPKHFLCFVLECAASRMFRSPHVL